LSKVSKVIVITSGKGGVGKTTSSAAIGAGLAVSGHKTVVIDFDIGLRNLDLVMGCERRVIYDFINVIRGETKLQQALIRDKRVDNLYILPASQTRDKDALTQDGVAQVIHTLKTDFNFDYIVCDSPAGLERGANLAMYFADVAVVVANPEVSSVRDADRILGLLSSKSQRAEKNEEPIINHLLLTRYDFNRVQKGEMLSLDDVLEILHIPLLGVIPESEAILQASNLGTPITLLSETRSHASQKQVKRVKAAYEDAVGRLLGQDIPHRFTGPERKGFFDWLLTSE
jgi:septum site-determining protein MinD